MSVKFCTNLFIGIILTVSFLSATIHTVEASNTPINKQFTISAYYSPTQNQKRYFRGSYENDVLLNGKGRVTASGSAIYKGAVAAPRNIQFGTLIEIKGKGYYMVEDRGSAIYDDEDKILRIDLWKGYGDDALNKALSWGMRNRKGWIYPQSASSIKVHYFNRNLDIDSSGADVLALQKQLNKMGFFDHNPTGYYGKLTQDAVFQYQVFKEIVSDRNFPGAGRVGPGTRKRLNLLNKSLELLRKNKREANKKNPPIEHYRKMLDDFYNQTLAYGDVNYNVYILQQKLDKLGHFNWPRFTYQFGDATKTALIDFQIKHGIIKSSSDFGAGVFGPTTRNKIKTLIE